MADPIDTTVDTQTSVDPADTTAGQDPVVDTDPSQQTPATPAVPVDVPDDEDEEEDQNQTNNNVIDTNINSLDEDLDVTLDVPVEDKEEAEEEEEVPSKEVDRPERFIFRKLRENFPASFVEYLDSETSWVVQHANMTYMTTILLKSDSVIFDAKGRGDLIKIGLIDDTKPTAHQCHYAIRSVEEVIDEITGNRIYELKTDYRYPAGATVRIIPVIYNAAPEILFKPTQEELDAAEEAKKISYNDLKDYPTVDGIEIKGDLTHQDLSLLPAMRVDRYELNDVDGVQTEGELLDSTYILPHPGEVPVSVVYEQDVDGTNEIEVTNVRYVDNKMSEIREEFNNLDEELTKLVTNHIDNVDEDINRAIDERMEKEVMPIVRMVANSTEKLTLKQVELRFLTSRRQDLGKWEASLAFTDGWALAVLDKEGVELPCVKKYDGGICRIYTNILEQGAFALCYTIR